MVLFVFLVLQNTVVWVQLEEVGSDLQFLLEHCFQPWFCSLIPISCLVVLVCMVFLGYNWNVFGSFRLYIFLSLLGLQFFSNLLGVASLESHFNSLRYLLVYRCRWCCFDCLSFCIFLLLNVFLFVFRYVLIFVNTLHVSCYLLLLLHLLFVAETFRGDSLLLVEF